MSTSRTIRSTLAFAFVIALGLGVSACNTFEGLGKDFTEAGNALGLGGDEQPKE
jgi:predicted small secreted protein